MTLVNYLNIVIKRLTRIASLASLMTLMVSGGAYAAFTLEKAQQLALSTDPGIGETLRNAEGLRSEAVAQGQLPDPVFLLGALNLPVDTFDFDQEPMTQLRFGIRQMFPQGNTLSLKKDRLMTRAGSLHDGAQTRYLQVRREVRRVWLEVLYWIRAKGILKQDRVLFQQLLDVTQSLYSVGKVQQQDVLRAELELARLHEKLIKADRSEQKSRAALARWVGHDARQAEWPNDIPELTTASLPLTGYQKGKMSNDVEDIAAILREHPLVEAMQKQVDEAEVELQIARAKYKPAWGVEVSYGLRDGENPDGTGRSDFFSAMVTMSMPFFTRLRQDKGVESSTYRVQARDYAVSDQVLELTGAVEQMIERLMQTEEQITLFRDELLAKSRRHAEAALTSYQSDTAGFDEVMRSYIREQKDRLDYQRLLIDRQQLKSELQFYFPATVPDLTLNTEARFQ